MFCSNGFAPMWMWFAPMVMRAVCSDGFDVASIGLLRCGCGLLRSVYHGSGGGVGLDRLWLVGLDRGDWWVSGFGSVLCMWIGAVGLDRCCGFGSVLLWSCLVIVVVGGDFGNFLCFFSSWWLFLMV